ncbi:MAG TPA: NAD(P)-dependent oxidoreductase [Coleofasciculaceae cyanobacterium]
MSEAIAFIGLGSMGLPIASNLIKAGYALRIYNRTPEKAQSLVAQGAELAKTPADAVTPGGIVITMLSNDLAVEAVVLGEQGILDALGPEGVHVSMSTIAPDTAHRLAEYHQQKGSHYLAAPVFGRPEAAAAAKLWICTSGHAAAKQRLLPLLNAVAQGIFDLGETATAAHVVKLTGNFLIMSAIEAMAEAFTLAEKNGIDRTQVAELFGQTLFACPIYQNYGRMIAQEQYEPAGFKLALGLKDVTLALQTASASQVPMPLANLVHNRLLTSVAKGRGDMDWTGFALEVSDDAGIQKAGVEFSQ